jgi:hypothetical protein
MRDIARPLGDNEGLIVAEHLPGTGKTPATGRFSGATLACQQDTYPVVFNKGGMEGKTACLPDAAIDGFEHELHPDDIQFPARTADGLADDVRLLIMEPEPQRAKVVRGPPVPGKTVLRGYSRHRGEEPRTSGSTFRPADEQEPALGLWRVRLEPEDSTEVTRKEKSCFIRLDVPCHPVYQSEPVGQGRLYGTIGPLLSNHGAVPPLLQEPPLKPVLQL